jgi:hypothetical protein
MVSLEGVGSGEECQCLAGTERLCYYVGLSHEVRLVRFD